MNNIEREKMYCYCVKYGKLIVKNYECSTGFILDRHSEYNYYTELYRLSTGHHFIFQTKYQSDNGCIIYKKPKIIKVELGR